MEMMFAIADTDGSIIEVSHCLAQMKAKLAPGQSIVEFADEDSLAEYAYEQGCPWADEDNDYPDESS